MITINSTTVILLFTHITISVHVFNIYTSRAALPCGVNEYIDTTSLHRKAENVPVRFRYFFLHVYCP